jgi:predicted RNA-binding Zn-ribbon protein involved in translation (DUF1610 family)
MRTYTWNVIDRGEVPEGARQVFYTCAGCGRDALLPVVGLVIAQIGSGLVFDVGPCATPKIIKCRKCRRVTELCE